MRAGSSAWCGVVLGMVTATGCAPFFAGEAGPSSPEGQGGPALYRGPGRAVALDGVYGAPAPAEELPAPAVEARGLAVEVRGPSVEARGPGVFLVRMPECCPGPVMVTVACAGGTVAPQDPRGPEDPAPPAPYKPWPDEGARVRLYHGVVQPRVGAEGAATAVEPVRQARPPLGI